jgi:hypothetical protein
MVVSGMGGLSTAAYPNIKGLKPLKAKPFTHKTGITITP